MDNRAAATKTTTTPTVDNDADVGGDNGLLRVFPQRHRRSISQLIANLGIACHTQAKTTTSLHLNAIKNITK